MYGLCDEFNNFSEPDHYLHDLIQKYNDQDQALMLGLDLAFRENNNNGACAVV